MADARIAAKMNSKVREVRATIATTVEKAGWTSMDEKLNFIRER